MGSARFCSPFPTDLMPLAAEHVHFIGKGFLVNSASLYNVHTVSLFSPHIFCSFLLFLCFFLCENGIHCGSKANTLSYWCFIHLVFRLPQNLFVCATVQQVVFGVIACVVQILFCFHVLIYMVGFYLQPEAVCVSIDELTLSPVLALKLIALKIVHQYFADIENHHPSIKRLVQFHTLFVHSETDEMVEK